MDILKKINLKSIGVLFHYLAFLSLVIFWDILLFGGFAINIGYYKISATELRKPFLLTIGLILLGKLFAPKTPFMKTPIGWCTQWIRGVLSKLRSLSSQNVFFWVTLIFLNILLFLPPFILQVRESTLIPVPPIDGPRGLLDTLLFFFRRSNQDFFRFSADFYLMITIIFLTLKFQWERIPQRIFIGFYFFLLLYQVYESSYLKIFGQKPLFYSDFLLIKDGAYLIFDLWSWKLFDSIVRVIFWGFVVLYFIRFSFNTISEKLKKIQLTRLSVIMGGFLWSLVIFSTTWYDPLDMRPTIQWVSVRITENLAESIKGFRSLRSINKDTWKDYYEFDFTFEMKPNIYLVMIESYGKILANHSKLVSPYIQRMSEIEDTLASYGWHIVTNYSSAPISGGKSWLSAVTLLSGIHIDNQATYSYLTRQIPNYPHLVRYMKNQGYYTIGLYPPMRERPGFSFEYHEKYYDYDRWIYYDDLDYQGDQYGWGMIPDQYSLNYTHDKFLSQINSPFFLFFPTVTSHSPWYDLPELIPDWRKYQDNHISSKEYRIHASVDNIPPRTGNRYTRHLKKQLGFTDVFQLDDYLAHMFYQFSFIIEYIVNRSPQNSIFILVGDHQPPIITKEKDGFQTPIHIISRDPSFLNTFESVGFVPGFTKSTTDEHGIKHEAIYSLLTRNLVKRYGSVAEDSLPPYIPDGVPLTIFIP